MTNEETPIYIVDSYPMGGGESTVINSNAYMQGELNRRADAGYSIAYPPLLVEGRLVVTYVSQTRLAELVGNLIEAGARRLEEMEANDQSDDVSAHPTKLADMDTDELMAEIKRRDQMKEEPLIS